MSSRGGRILFLLLLGGAAIGLFVQRLGGAQEEAMREAESAEKAGKMKEAVAAYRRVLRSDFPFSSRSGDAIEALIRIGDRAREEGNEELSKLADRSLVGGRNASSLRRPADDERYEDASKRLGLTHGSKLDRSLGVSPTAVLLASFGLALSLFFGFRLLLPAAGHDLPVRRMLLDAGLFASGLALFVAALLAA
ncbi:MAG: hypothetical protein GX614_05995 [Sandaracinaceae bacterium]|nr:hypothetical protein [Sandaracinaceae bacterium]